MRQISSTPIPLLFVTLLLTSASWASESSGERLLPVAPGGTLQVHNDFGRTFIRGWDGDRVKLQFRKMASDPNRLDKITLKTREGPEQTRISVRFDDHVSESAYLEIHAPRSLGILVWGTHSAIELHGLEGPVQAWTLSGLLTSEDVTSSVSLRTQSGDILFRTGTQPRGDIRLESFEGKITCQLSPDLDLRGWIRAGGTLSWNGDVELRNGSLQRNLGVGGPLLYASSLSGNVLCRILRPDSIRTRPARVDQVPAERVLPRGGVQRISHVPEAKQERDVPSPVPKNAPARVSLEQERSGDPESAPMPASNSGYALKVQVNWVYLNVSVRDPRNNRSVSNLTRDDFLIYEDDVLQTVRKFEPTEAPFRVLLLLDVSGSTRPHLDLLQRASADFSREIRTNDQIAVATFNSRSWLILPFTSDREKVRTAIDGIYSGGGTALYDALMDSLNEYSDEVNARQAIVVFTDGVDNQLTGNRTEGSRTTFPQLFGEIRESDSLIYPIFLDHRNNVGPRPRGMVGRILQKIPQPRRPNISIKQQDRNVYVKARRQLASIADQTGARFYSPRRIQELGDIFSEIADDLRVRYLLAYTVPQPQRDRSWRSIRVEIRDRPDFVTRTRQGYYSGSGSD